MRIPYVPILIGVAALVLDKKARDVIAEHYGARFGLDMPIRDPSSSAGLPQPESTDDEVPPRRAHNG